MVFSSLHEVSVSVMKLFPVVARAETGADRRWEDGPPRSSAHHWRCSSPRACARLAGEWAKYRLKLETEVSLNRLNFLSHGTVLMLCWTLCFQNTFCPTTDL